MWYLFKVFIDRVIEHFFFRPGQRDAFNDSPAEILCWARNHFGSSSIVKAMRACSWQAREVVVRLFIRIIQLFQLYTAISSSVNSCYGDLTPGIKELDLRLSAVIYHWLSPIHDRLGIFWSFFRDTCCSIMGPKYYASHDCVFNIFHSVLLFLLRNLSTFALLTFLGLHNLEGKHWTSSFSCRRHILHLDEFMLLLLNR